MLFLKFPSLLSSAAPSRLHWLWAITRRVHFAICKTHSGCTPHSGQLGAGTQHWAVPSRLCLCFVFSSAATAFVRVSQQPHVTPYSPGRLLKGAGSFTGDNVSFGLAWSRPRSEASSLTSKCFLPVPEAAFEVLCPSHRRWAARMLQQEACQHYCPKTGWAGAGRVWTPLWKISCHSPALGADRGWVRWHPFNSRDQTRLSSFIFLALHVRACCNIVLLKVEYAGNRIWKAWHLQYFYEVLFPVLLFICFLQFFSACFSF